MWLWVFVLRFVHGWRRLRSMPQTKPLWCSSICWSDQHCMNLHSCPGTLTPVGGWAVGPLIPVSFRWLWGCVWGKCSSKWHCGVWGSLCKCQVQFYFLKNGFSSEGDRDIGDIAVGTLPLSPLCPVHLYWWLPWAVESKGKTCLLFIGEVRTVGK